MSSRPSKVAKRNGVGTSFLSLTRRALHKTGTGLINLANQFPLPHNLSRDEKALLTRNSVFKNKHKGRRGFVIGTGPSIQTQDLSPLRNEITFSLSAFWKHSIISEWRPTYYCFSDPLLFDGSETMKEFFKNLNQHVPDSTFFVPLSGREMIEREQLLPERQTYYASFVGDLSEQPALDVDMTKAIPGVMNVAQFCMLAAIYMGMSPIYLMGLDHDWLSHQGETKHFYKGHAGLEKHPEVKPVLADWSYRHLMECQLVGWKAYENLARLAALKGIKIYNATDGGFLDVYERAGYREVVR